MTHKSKSSVKNNRNFAQRYYYTGHYQSPTRIRLTYYNKEKLKTVPVDPRTESFPSLLEPNCLHWFEVQGLTDDITISRILEQFGMHSLDTREVLTPAHVVKIELNNNTIMVILNSCSISNDRRAHSDHVSLVIKKNVVISFNESHMPLFENVYQALQNNVMNIREEKTGLLFGFLLNSIMVDLIESA
ncbi:MAG: magnesium and cobalt transport protein CorA, partial [Tannerellaceae bacterium]|nr:magnesium and cobalt transport protein CorA [Tannerellaceae bacterium]